MDQKQLSKLIGQLSSEELRAYTLAFLEENPKIAIQFCNFIDNQLSTVGVDNAEQEVETYFKATKNVGDRWHSYWITDWESISHNSSKLFSRAHDAISAGNPDIALAIGVRWLELFAEDFDEGEACYYDDEDWYFADDCEKVAKVIDAAMAHPRISEGAKKEAARRLEELSKRNNTPFYSFNYLDIKGLSARANAMTRSDEEALKYLEDLLDEDFDNTTLIIQKYKLLKKMGRQDEAEAFIEENTDNLEVADFYVSELLEDKRYDKLIAILKDITDPEFDQYNQYLTKWLETLASILDEIGNTDEATAVFRHLFIESKGDLKYYKNLKDRVEPTLWSDYLEELMSKTRFQGTIYSGKCNYADILVEEGLDQKLHDWLKKESSDAFAYYLHKVPQNMRADLIPIYANLILKSASCADKRYLYANVCSHLQKIKELPEGASPAQEIATEIRNKYSRRPAFMDELRTVMVK